MEITRTFELLDWISEKYQKNDLLAGKKDGEWITYSINDYIKYSTLMSYGFYEIGLRKGDKVVTIAGIHGTINKVNEDGTIQLEVSPGSYIKIEKSAISLEWSMAANKAVTADKK